MSSEGSGTGTEEKTVVRPDDGELAATAMLVVALGIVLPIGIGLLAGAGVGWLTFALFLILLALRFLYVSAEKRKKGKA